MENEVKEATEKVPYEEPEVEVVVFEDGGVLTDPIIQSGGGGEFF